MSTVNTAERPYRGTSPDERRAQRRARLIASAIEVYGELGYRHSGIKQVCEGAGLTQRYFYEAFAHSDELLIACYELVNSALMREIARAVEAAGPGQRDRGKAMLLAYFKALKREPRRANLFLVDIRGISHEVDAAIDKALRTIGRQVVEALVVPGHEPDELLQAGILGGVIHIALRWIANGYKPSVEQVAETAFKLSSVLLEG
ncbi:MAG: TetR/AcrR family transcriptional regulator [Gammaproteobacteria bacterium]